MRRFFVTAKKYRALQLDFDSSILKNQLQIRDLRTRQGELLEEIKHLLVVLDRIYRDAAAPYRISSSGVLKESI